jgi:hypothetical protein
MILTIEYVQYRKIIPVFNKQHFRLSVYTSRSSLNPEFGNSLNGYNWMLDEDLLSNLHERPAYPETISLV